MAVSPEEVLQGLADIAGMLGHVVLASQGQQVLMTEMIGHMNQERDKVMKGNHKG